MGPSEKTFNQVKNILGKLDRSIDQLRQQRTTPALAPTTHHESLRIVPSPAPTPARSNSSFGRATPIRPA